MVEIPRVGLTGTGALMGTVALFGRGLKLKKKIQKHNKNTSSPQAGTEAWVLHRPATVEWTREERELATLLRRFPLRGSAGSRKDGVCAGKDRRVHPEKDIQAIGGK